MSAPGLAVMSDELLSISGYTFLALAILSLWISKSPTLWGSLLTLAAIFGLASGRLGWLGLAQICGFGALVHFYYRRRLATSIEIIVGLCIVGLSLALFSHRLPGFNNWTVVSDVRFSSDSLPYSFFLNWDKPVVGLFIIAFGMRLAASKRDWQRILVVLVPLMGLAAVVMLSASFALGYIRLDPKLPEVTALWALKNLLFTCVAEEALFRGFIQEELSRRLGGKPWGNLGALGIASILFGLAHFAGGASYVILATVAGLFYGAAYLKTQRIESSILFHFTLNLIHFLGFSYPALSAAGTV